MFKVVTRIAQRIHIYAVVKTRGNHLYAVYLLGTVGKFRKRAVCHFALKAFKLAFKRLVFLCNRRNLLQHLRRIGLNRIGYIGYKFFRSRHMFKHAKAGYALDTSYARRNSAFGGYFKKSYVARVGNMSTAAEFHAVVAHFNNSDGFSVFLAEQSGCAHLLCLVYALYHSFNRHRRKNMLVYISFNLSKLLRSHRGEV